MWEYNFHTQKIRNYNTKFKNMIREIIRLLRPHQWLKNAFVFMPLFFDRHATEWNYVWPCIVAFAAFCLTASGVYCLNDVCDAEADRRHPSKRMRPVASGAVSKRMAYGVMAVLWVAAFALTGLCFCGSSVALELSSTLLLYLLMNVAYCLRLKRVAILDVFVIAVGFVLRIAVGGIATGIWLSHWIVITTFLLALFLALAKRRDDMTLYEDSGIRARQNIERYNRDFLASAIAILGSVTIMCYILYTLSNEVLERTGSKSLYATSAFVLAGILRYLQLIFVDGKSGSPTQILLHDNFIQTCIAGWIAMFVIILYIL